MNSTRINRVLQVHELIALNPEPTRLKEIGDTLQLHPSMVSRIVADLAAGGLIVKCAYRSVIPAPALALLGTKAGENHPLTRITQQLLQPFAEKNALSCEFAAVTPFGLHHFFYLRYNLPAPAPIWRSDPAAVIFASEGASDEEVRERLKPLTPPDHREDLNRFTARVADARENRFLINRHAGRFCQLTLPVRCGTLFCALSVAAENIPDTESLFMECSRMAIRISSLYGQISNADAQS